MSKRLVFPVLAASLSLPLSACQEGTKETNSPGEEEEAAEWSYEGNSGPEYWGELDSDYSTCVDGREQSPINIEFSDVSQDEELESIDINYQPAAYTLVHNGHTIQAENSIEYNNIIVNDTEYTLDHFHFHTPSEHLFNEEHYEMEMHLVHENEKGETAVLGVMIQEGETNEELSAAWNNLPASESREEVAINDPIDLQALLPQKNTTFHYNGSLTTPPCSEEVEWIIYKQPIAMSQEQIKDFQEIFPDNHRHEQDLNEREVIENK
ncbi:carbonic anhydrase [Alteribacillus sp. HJP-4]|uniref:carbonic anhydrase n=1 Tax=Alteribacillus sp. HJP-4 TaxID=2775394 RepID=UPI0035CD2A79